MANHSYLNPIIPGIQHNSWKSIEEEWPEDASKKYLFYNPVLDIYEVSSIDRIDADQKHYAQSLNTIADHDDVDPKVKYYIKHRHAYTHYMDLPKPPERE